MPPPPPLPPTDSLACRPPSRGHPAPSSLLHRGKGRAVLISLLVLAAAGVVGAAGLLGKKLHDNQQEGKKKKSS